jgi:hypothetical protein
MGSHWVSLFVDFSRKSFPLIFFMDSGGDHSEEIPDEIQKLIHRICTQGKECRIKFKVFRNLVDHQKENTECGMYSLFMIITMLTEETECRKCNGKDVKHRSIDELLYLFQKEPIPDKYVEQYRKIYFNPVIE